MARPWFRRAVNYARIEVNQGTRVAALSLGLLLGLLAFACGGPDTADHMPESSVAATAGSPNSGDGHTAMDAESIVVSTAADGGDGTGEAGTTGRIGAAIRVFNAPDGWRAIPAVARQTVPAEDAADRDGRPNEVVNVPTTVDLPAVSDTANEPPAIAPPFGSTGAVAVNEPAGSFPPRVPNDALVLHPIARIDGEFAPKSVVASGTGLYFAQNMMYRHTISVLNHRKELVATIDDSVDLRGFGYDVSGGVYRGAPAEAAFTSDGSFAFVSNYRMYGPGYDPEAGSDSCGKDPGQDSFVYRISVSALTIDLVYPVGPVPNHLAVTPDDRLLLVSIWCGFSP